MLHHQDFKIEFVQSIQSVYLENSLRQKVLQIGIILTRFKF